MVNLVKVYGSNEHPSKFSNVRLPYLVEVEFTAEELIEAKGSAIAAADVFDLIGVPPGTAILNAWLQKGSAFEGTSTDITLDLGITGVDADRYVDGWGLDDAAVGAHAPRTVTLPEMAVVDAQTNLTVLVATMTGSWTGGAIRVQALLLDLRDKGGATFEGIAQLGS